jgi:hypothetical protein
MVQFNYREIALANPSFEDPYVNRGGNFVARGWTPIWSTDDPPQEKSQGPCYGPEYKKLEAAEFPYRVTDGQAAQCWFLRNKVFEAGVYQVVDIEDIDFLQLQADGQAYCTDGDDPAVSEGEMYLCLGIDLYGRTNPWERGVMWSAWRPVDAEYQTIRGPVVQVVTSPITVFLIAWNKWRMSHNDVIVDNAHLYGITLEDEGGSNGGEPSAPVDYDEIERRVAHQIQRLTLRVE